MPAVKAITFDFWDTLVIAQLEGLRDRRLDALLGLIEGEGFAAERQAVGDAYDAGFGDFQRAWHAGEQFHARDAVDRMLDQLAIDVAPAVREQLVEATYTGTHDLEMTPNAPATLRALKDGGLRIGIICDVGLTPSTKLRETLVRHDVLELFDHWSFSDEVGHYKPAPEIFAHALAGLGLDDPADAAHIGDLRRTDVAGARGAGWRALRYAGVFDDTSDAEEADDVIRDHVELPAVLGVAG